LSPGIAVAGGGANTDGENLLPPVGSRPFSVGVADGAVVLVVVVVVVVEGLSVLLLPQAAVSAPSPTMAMAPAAAAKRRDFMLGSYPYSADGRIFVQG
jgi:hypothetical protein